MSFDSTFFFFLATPAYFLAFFGYLLGAVLGDREPNAGPAERSSQAMGIAASPALPRTLGWFRWATTLTVVGVGLGTIGVVLRSIELGQASDWAISVFLPITTTYETLTFMAWLIPLAYLIFERRYHFPGVGAIVTGISFTMLALSASPTIAPRAVAPVVPALQSYWLVIHVIFMIIGIALFTTGFGASLLLLWRRFRGQPPEALKKLEELSYKANAIGFPFYGIGGIVFGGIWAKQAWGAYWEWDPKETAMLIAWLAYAVYLHLRLHFGWRDIKVAWASVAAYGVVLYAWIGINYFVASLHSFT
ncbi:MAG: cytochrome c biogenesis protein CcsA [Candidatus Bipolaricaulia bacterium]